MREHGETAVRWAVPGHPHDDERSGSRSLTLTHRLGRRRVVDEATIGARLRILRRWRGMTLAELSGLAGVSLSYLSMVERG